MLSYVASFARNLICTLILAGAMFGCSEGGTTREVVRIRGVSLVPAGKGPLPSSAHDVLILDIPTCGGKPVATATESGDVVRLRVVSTVSLGGNQPSCADLARATLAQPLAGRIVVDAATGKSVSVR
jgi:hypothetical protein